MQQKILIIASSLVVSAVAEQCSPPPLSSFYAGISAGANINHGRVNTDGLKNLGTPASRDLTHRNKIGVPSVITNLFLGYGTALQNSLYFGGELYIGYDALKKTIFDDSLHYGEALDTIKVTYQRNLLYGIKARFGQFLAPNVLAYLSLGLESGRIRIRSENTQGESAENLNKNDRLRYKSSHPVLFVPGFGLEVSTSSNTFFRFQYDLALGRKLKLKDIKTEGDNAAIDPNAIGNGTVCIRLYQHRLQFGFGYKF